MLPPLIPFQPLLAAGLCGESGIDPRKQKPTPKLRIKIFDFE
jgi:hypothetical protein